MTKSRMIIGVGLIGVIAVAALAYAFLRPPEEASEPIAAVPLAPGESATSAPESQSDDVTIYATEDAGNTAETETSDPASESLSAGAGGTLFQIVQNESFVRFSIGEILRGSPNTAVGTTNQVSGEISTNLTDLSTVQVGTILVNARTLATDNNLRNRAISNQILDSNQFEFITFVPTAITGLPDQAILGEPVEFQITGDLTIRDITKEATFTAVVTAISADRMEGTAEAIVLRSDYNIPIPNVPSVAEVDDEVQLEISFVASSA